MSMIEYYKSINTEFEALQNRITYLIGHTHHATTGGYQESLLRSFLSRYLPDNIGVARGFVVFEQRQNQPYGNQPNNLDYNSNEIDILLYDKNRPVLYKDSSELVIVEAKSVKGIIEVKRNSRGANLDDIVQKLARNVHEINRLKNEENIFAGIFAYEADRNSLTQCLNSLQQYTDSNTKIINHVCLGSNTFIKFWRKSPDMHREQYNQWHQYGFQENLAKGYFIYNLLTAFNHDVNEDLWFPHYSKEIHLDSQRPLRI